MAEKNRTFSIRNIIRMLFFVAVIPFLPLLVTGKWGWLEAWFYALVNLLGFAASRIIAGKRNPGLLKERSKFLQHADAKSWDRLLAPLTGLGGGLIPLTAALQARFAAEIAFNWPLKAAAIVIFLGSFAFSSWALVENRFFSGMVRIQKERGHTVITSGPYRIIRHPGYAGALLAYLSTPVLLDSTWAIVPALLLLVVLVIRTRLEDATLQAELDGYKEYAQKVRFRLIPGVW